MVKRRRLVLLKAKRRIAHAVAQASEIICAKKATQRLAVNIDLHSHFFPIDALQNPGKYEDRAPKLVLDKGQLSVRSQIGFRSGLAPGAYDASARIKALDDMQIDLQAISPSPILLFYWEEAAVAAHFSRQQNEAIHAVVRRHSDRFVGFGSVPLQNVADSIAIAEEAKSMGLKGLEIGNAVGDKSLDDPSFEPFFSAAAGRIFARSSPATWSSVLQPVTMLSLRTKRAKDWSWS
jgi:predicted TIM-barrel fold metal-dependent hydrolase